MIIIIPLIVSLLCINEAVKIRRYYRDPRNSRSIEQECLYCALTFMVFNAWAIYGTVCVMFGRWL
jgi:hypothetical protein